MKMFFFSILKKEAVKLIMNLFHLPLSHTLRDVRDTQSVHILVTLQWFHKNITYFATANNKSHSDDTKFCE